MRRAHPGGSIECGPYPNLGNMIEEFGEKPKLFVAQLLAIDKSVLDDDKSEDELCFTPKRRISFVISR